jgi:hypothetical protein
LRGIRWGADGNSPAVLFAAVNNAELALRAPLLLLFTSAFGIHYLASNALTFVF